MAHSLPGSSGHIGIECLPSVWVKRCLVTSHLWASFVCLDDTVGTSTEIVIFLMLLIILFFIMPVLEFFVQYFAMFCWIRVIDLCIAKYVLNWLMERSFFYSGFCKILCCVCWIRLTSVSLHRKKYWLMKSSCVLFSLVILNNRDLDWGEEKWDVQLSRK